MSRNFRQLHLPPYLYLTPSVIHRSVAIFALLLPQFIMLFVTRSFSNVFIVLVSILATALAELTSNLIRHKNTFYDLTFLVQGFMIGMLIPSSYPILAVFIFVYLSMLFSKHIFGYTGDSWVNSTVFTAVFLYIVGMGFFPENVLTRQIMESAQPGLSLISNGSIAVQDFDSKMTFWLNTHLFAHTGIEIPNGYISLFWDSASPIPAFRFNFLTLISSIILISFDLINFIIPTVYLLFYGILVYLFSLTSFTSQIGQGDILLSLLTSGTLFTAFFLLDFYGTSPKTIVGRVVYALFAGLLSFLICGAGMSSSGNFFVVLVCNIFSPVIQYVEDKTYILHVNKLFRKNNYA